MGGRFSDDSVFSVILSVLLGDLNKAHSRMSSLSLVRDYIGFFPWDVQNRIKRSWMRSGGVINRNQDRHSLIR